MKSKFAGLFVLMIAFSIPPVLAQAMAPDSLNYQGVLRDPGNAPLTGDFQMVFRFFDAPSAGNEILSDTHMAVGVENGRPSR